MKPDEIRSMVLRALAGVAPEADPAEIDSERNLRDQLDIDSVDFLNFVIALHKAAKIDIPEKDYPRLATLRGCVEYLASRGAAVDSTST